MKRLVFALCLAAMACSPKQDETPKPPFKAAIEVTDEGYKPARIDVERNQPVTLVFTRTTESTCGEKVVIPSQNIHADLPLNTPVEVSFTTHDEGTIAFACGMDMLKGAVVVH